jgi:hypothetical protein
MCVELSWDNYLGLSLSPNGKFTLAVKQRLADKAHRAMNSTRKKLDICKLPPNLAVKIFDSIISPILLYNSEVWGAFANHDLNKWDQSPTEKIHSKFCKIYLGVNRKATNIASRGEMGKFPLLIAILKRLMKYIVHINTLPDYTIVKQAFLLSKDLFLDNKPCFYSNVMHLIKNYASSTDELNDLELTTNSHLRQYVDNAKVKYTNFWKHKLNNSTKLDFYKKFKTDYKLEEYLTNIKNQPQRRALSQFRISCHKLNVECGRYHNVPREQRLCEFCDMGEVEDECHFALFCKYYTNDRKILKEKLRLEFTTKLDCHDDLQSIMSFSDPKLLNVFSKYILTCFTKRNECLETGNNITRPND